MTRKQVARLILGVVCLFGFFLNAYTAEFLITFHKVEWWLGPTLIAHLAVFYGTGVGAYMSFWAAFDTELFGK